MARPSRVFITILKAFLLFFAIALHGENLAADSGSLWGRTVVDVRLEADANLTLSEFAAEISQQKNQPLDPFKVNASLKNLYATGRFLTLAADAKLQGEGVVLVFRASARYFVGTVRVVGTPKSVDPAALASGSGLRLGQPLSEESLTQAKSSVVSVLAASGYYDAQVALNIQRHADSEESDLTLEVTAGPAARLAGIGFTGSPGVPIATLIRVGRWRTGVQLTSARLARGLSRLHTFYLKGDHLEAAVNSEKRTFDARTNTERLTVKIDAGPQIRIRLVGARISASDLRNILPAYREASADQLTLLDGEQALENYFQQKGYLRARVNLSQQTSSGTQGSRDITYSADLGPRGSFVGYRFQGNRSVPNSDLAGAVLLQPVAFQLRRGRFDHDLLDRSVQALTVLYRSRGFADARVSTSLNENYQGRADHLLVTFIIQEGSQTHVRKMTITGLGEDVHRQIESSLLTLSGRPYSAERAQADRDSILSYLGNHGFAQATVEWHASEPTAQREVDVEYQVETGAEETIARVVVLGNEFTRDSVINGQLSMTGGEPLSQSELLQSQQHLYDLGLFNQVQVTTQDPASPSAQKTVLVGLEEARRWTLGYGGGLDVQRLPGNGSQGQYGVSPRVSLELNRINLDGRPQTYTLAGHFSNLEKIGSTSYDIPRFLGHPGLDLRVTGLVDQSRNVLTFDSKRQELAVTMQKRFSPHSSLLARYNFRHVSVSNLQINPASVPLLSQGVLVATVGGGYVNDHRDNPVDATRGSYTSFDVDVAWTGLGSSADFGRITGQNSTYYRLGRRVILARNTRAGLEPTYGHTTVDEGVPLPERFFMGGADSDRAFSLNEAGPRDPITGFPLGGKALFLNQIELRFPLEQNHLGLVAFEDAGNVFSTVRQLRLLKFTQGPPTDFNYDVQAAGLGLRYQTPVGPVRFDVAYSPNIPQFQTCANPSLSACPVNDVEVLRLPRVQFVLSVGQSF